MSCFFMIYVSHGHVSYEESYEIPIIDFPTILLFGQTY